MNDARPRQIWSLIVLGIAGTPCACQHDATDSKRDPAALDGMERSAARRVGLESTIDAMQRGDLNRLKMLSVWARTRAQVALFEADDLSSLDLAIECLDGSMTHADRLTALAKIKSGQLLKPARDLCLAGSE
jgi:hypothetical protein